MPSRSVTCWFPFSAAKPTERKSTTNTPATVASRVTCAPRSRRLRRDRHLQRSACERRAAGVLQLHEPIRPDPFALALERDDLVAARAAEHLHAVSRDALHEHLVHATEL